jgi:RND superfamily putative drug exporter
VISFLASLGYSNILYPWLVGVTAVDQSVPLLGFVFLVALGVDYNIFLMTRAAEETPDRGLKTGTIHALVTTGGVITSAGLVLAATFAVLAILPLTILAQIGVLVSVGVLLDTFLVRTILVPTLAVKLGRGFWWPRFRHLKPEK